LLVSVLGHVTGMLESIIDDVRNVAIFAGGRFFCLGDVAQIERNYTDLPEPKMFYNGKPAIGIAASMENGSNTLTLGENLSKAVAEIKKNLLLGMEMKGSMQNRGRH
jgi:multidrug efflux pump